MRTKNNGFWLYFDAGCKYPSVEGGYMHNLPISVARARFDPKSADFVHCVLEKALTKTIKCMSTEIRNCFSAVYITEQHTYT